MPAPVLTTPRLRLRCIEPADWPAFAAMNADPQVMEWLPKPLTREESDATAVRMATAFAQFGYGKWALQIGSHPEFIGYAGLAPTDFDAPFTPAVEIGWRLARPYWGQGYATEAARAAVDFAFHQLKLEKIVSFTVPGNQRSLRVMERLGLKRDPRSDFDHPKLPVGHRLRRHLVYQITQSEWLGSELCLGIK